MPCIVPRIAVGAWSAADLRGLTYVSRAPYGQIRCYSHRHAREAEAGEVKLRVRFAEKEQSGRGYASYRSHAAPNLNLI
jgi:hypothetical protein